MFTQALVVTSKFLLDAPSLKAVTFREWRMAFEISNNRLLSRPEFGAHSFNNSGWHQDFCECIASYIPSNLSDQHWNNEDLHIIHSDSYPLLWLLLLWARRHLSFGRLLTYSLHSYKLWRLNEMEILFKWYSTVVFLYTGLQDYNQIKSSGTNKLLQAPVKF